MGRAWKRLRAGGGVAAEEFDRLYQAQYGNVVAMAYALTGDLTEAQDLAQEGFFRAWQRWDRLAGYDDPVSWVRRVVGNLATSRWRRLAVARRHLRRQRAESVPALNPDHVAVVAALRRLPGPHRHAIVLHHLVDLPVTEVARELGVSAGTVKSWLHRGRTNLASALRDPERAPAPAAPALEAPIPEAPAPQDPGHRTEVGSVD